MTYGEDWEMWVRIARYYPVAYTPELLADYRTHDHSLTWFDIVNGNISNHIERTISAIQAHLPEKNRKAILNSTKRYYARTHIVFAQQMWIKKRSKEQAEKHLHAALSLHKSMRIFYHVLKLRCIMQVQNMQAEIWRPPLKNTELKP